MTMKATWLGEDGAGDRMTMGNMVFEAGKEREVPETIGVGLLGNPFFKVEASADEDEGTAARNRGGRPRKPTTVDEYRAYASTWIGKAATVEDLETRWKSEEELRASVGWTDEDQRSFQPAYDARLAELKPKPPVVEIPGPKPGEPAPGTASK